MSALRQILTTSQKLVPPMPESSSTEPETMAAKIITAYHNDLAQSSVPEFPVTPMSRALVRAVLRVLSRRGQDFPSHALDVGTGSGIQSAVLALAGCHNVDAIDISAEAVSSAEKRIKRLASHLSAINTPFAVPAYKVADVANIPDGRWDVIVTNPPSYFCDDSPQTPLEWGLLDGSSSHSHDPTRSFLYRFFKYVVGPRLNPGGVAICTWPGIQMRLVHDLSTDCRGEAPPPIVHPSSLLDRWFNWDVRSGNKDWNQFFHTECSFSASGMGEDIMRQIKEDIHNGGCYSSLVRMANGATYFRFGVMALHRDDRDPNSFRLEVVPAPDK